MFGLKNVVIRNLRTAIQDGRIPSKEELIKDLESMKKQISEVENELIETFDKQENCDHAFGECYFMFQKRTIGYVYVYERTCKQCGRTERETHEESISNPFGVEQEAIEKYYNNYI